MRVSGLFVGPRTIHSDPLAPLLSSILGGVLQGAVWSLHCGLYVSHLQRRLYVR